MTAPDAEQLRDRLVANESAFGFDLDQRFLVYGGSAKGEVAFIPTVELPRTTPEMLSSGAMLGLVAIDPSEYDQQEDSLQEGVFAVRHTMPTDGASEGTSELLDASGSVVATTPVRLLASREKFMELEKAADVVLGEVGGVTVSVGWLHVCFDWDDPPGSGGMCHHSCHGW